MPLGHHAHRRLTLLWQGGLVALMLILAVELYAQLARHLPHCSADTLLITSEANRMVVARGHWKVQNRILHATGNYSGVISYYTPDQTLQRREPVAVSFELSHSLSGAALRTETTAIAYNIGNRADPVSIERYISAGLGRGHVNYGWIYRLQDKRYVIGNNVNPSIICR